eukprot:TRINITY_DN33536_c0_g1_i1.p1 TRINITY_DN33536_c0_g1~~TRINITY_DN33536_c0_g1_i1.p1  ORF type:complete len:558 (+),score=73.60 TRINITY_DN33536_c0_g1_i1:50-1723(+)
MGAGCCKGEKNEKDDKDTRVQRYGQGAYEDGFEGVIVESGKRRESVLRSKIRCHLQAVGAGDEESVGSQMEDRSVRLLHSSSRGDMASHTSVADSLTYVASEVETQLSSAPPSPLKGPPPWSRLVCLDPTFPTIDISSEQFTFGRALDCTHRCCNSMVSHRQFTLSLVDKRTHSVEIQDLSTNGTYITPGLFGISAKVQGTRSLHHGDTITFQIHNDKTKTKAMHPGYIFQMTGYPYRDSGFETRTHTHYKVGSHVLGTGGSAVVYLGLNKDTGELLAVKKLRKVQDGDEELRLQEVEILSRLNHSNIVQYIGADHEQKTGQFNVLLEFVPGGSIACLLGKFGALDDCVIRNYMVQIIAGLRYLHEHDVVHMDLKAANILVTAQGKCKLTDFGAACKGEGMLSQRFLGTPLWMAPEVARERVATKRSDIWSLGCTMLEMATGKHPWVEKGFENQMSVLNFQRNNTSERPLLPPTCKLSHMGRELIHAATHLAPSLRPLTNTLLAHPFIKGTFPPPENSTHTSIPSDGLITSSSLTFNDFESLSIADISPPVSLGNSQ